MLRLATFYGPVWIVIIATFTIYSLVGRNIYMNRVSNIYVQQQLDTNCSESTSAISKSELCSRLGSVVGTHEPNVEICPFSPIREKDLSSASSYPQSACEPSLQFPNSRHASKDPVFLARKGSIVPLVTPKDTQHRSKLSWIPTRSNTSPHTSRSTQYTAPITGQMNNNAWRGAQTYAHVAILLFIIMVIYWVPSTVNRLYSFNHPPNFGLNVAAAAVQPLQGFFNCVIYCFTSRSQLTEIWSNAKDRWWHKSPVVRSSMGSTALSPNLLDVERRIRRQSRLDMLDNLVLNYDLDEESRVGGEFSPPASTLTEKP